LDMLEGLPRFAVDDGADPRGFADGAGNVLIDGVYVSPNVFNTSDHMRIFAETIRSIAART